jgi:hypothetical protein
MPTYFEIVAKVLDRGYEEILGNDRDKKIAECLAGLSKRYGNVLAEGGPSYEDNLTRFAYVFGYATAHSDYLSTIIDNSKLLRAALAADQIEISCIGGGPGSDVLGFSKFLLRQQKKPQLTYFILDKESAWGETWADLDAIISSELKTSRTYLPLDVTQQDSYKKYARPFKADVFTMLYFLSEIYKFKDKVTPFLQTCFDRMKNGALLVVLDFDDSRLRDWIDEYAKNGGLVTEVGKSMRMTMDPSEEKAALKKYADKFERAPKLQADVFIRIFRKA